MREKKKKDYLFKTISLSKISVLGFELNKIHSLFPFFFAGNNFYLSFILELSFFFFSCKNFQWFSFFPISSTTNVITWPVGLGCRIHRLLLCRGVRPQNECPVYDTKQYDGEVPVMQEIWGMQSTSLLLSLHCSLWPGAVAHIFMGQKELNRGFERLLFLDLNCIFILNWIV